MPFDQSCPLQLGEEASHCSPAHARLTAISLKSMHARLEAARHFHAMLQGLATRRGRPHRQGLVQQAAYWAEEVLAGALAALDVFWQRLAELFGHLLARAKTA